MSCLLFEEFFELMLLLLCWYWGTSFPAADSGEYCIVVDAATNTTETLYCDMDFLGTSFFHLLQQLPGDWPELVGEPAKPATRISTVHLLTTPPIFMDVQVAVGHMWQEARTQLMAANKTRLTEY